MMDRRSQRSRGIRRLIGAAAAAVLGLVVAGPATADHLPIDLLTDSAARFDGAAASDYSGWSVALAGDVNGDGYDDVLVGSPYADVAGLNSGATYVIFGSDNPASIDLNTLGTAGFRILGAAAGDISAYSVAGVGDVNDDSYDDVLIGSPYADVPGRTDSGAAYLVFGKTDTDDVSLASLGTGGLRLSGAAAGDLTGWSVAGAGDVNDDKIPDLAIGAQSASNNSRTYSGSTYVVFGSDSAGGLDLASLGTRGYRIDGPAEYHRSGLAVAGPGDVNGDGYDDVLIGAGWAGKAYLAFGKSDTGAVDLASLGTGGFTMNGTPLDRSGWSVAGPGDVNDDGTPDLLIGAPLAGNNNRAASGTAYVVFGNDSTDPVNLDALGAGGMRIDGASGDEQCGYAVAGAGDVDGDGVSDVALGAPKASNNGRLGAGSSYVIYGTDTPADIDTATLGPAGFRIDGAADVDKSGSAVAGAGDVNGDGNSDVLIGAPEADNNSRSTSGSSYLILKPPPVFTVPGAPTGVTGTPGDQQVELSWNAPGSDGGAPITGYRIETRVGDGDWTVTIPDTDATVTSQLMTGLTNGTAYQFRVSAINAAGVGPASIASAAVTPRTVPGAPTSPMGEPGDQQVQLSWTAPASDGGAAITGYQIEVSVSDPGGPWSTAIADTGSPATSATVTGLTNGTTYYFRIRAINSAGAGPHSVPLPVKPRTVPGAPTGVTGTPGDQQVQLSWTAPTSDGGAPITGYRIQTSMGGGAWTSFDTGNTSTTHTLTGLTNGTAYQFRVAAINSAGAGPASTATGSLTPVAPPPPPTTPPTVIPAATLAVTARSADAKVARKGKATLVRTISTGPGQTITTTVKVAPGAAKKKVKVTKTATSVTVRTKKSPKASITVTITASGPGVTPTTWTRTWKVR